jgi:hypothetical protein
MLTQQQRTDISSMNFLNIIDDQIRVMVEFVHKGLVEDQDGVELVVMVLFVFYQDEPLTKLSFNLRNYEFHELQYIGKNIRDNEFIMSELDMVLSTFGD